MFICIVFDFPGRTVKADLEILSTMIASKPHVVLVISFIFVSFLPSVVQPQPLVDLYPRSQRRTIA